MPSFCKAILILSVFLCSSVPSLGQTQQVSIRLIANCGMSLSDGRSTIYVDFPYKSGFWIYPEYPKAELQQLKDSAIYLFTHKHPDHYSIRQVKRARKKKHGSTYGPWNIKKMEQLHQSLSDFSIQVFQTKHLHCFHHCSYLITWHGKKIFLSGDTEHADTIALQKDLDWAFVPAWLLIDAVNKKIKINATDVGIYHLSAGDRITIDNPKFHLMDKPGQVIVLPY